MVEAPISIHFPAYKRAYLGQYELMPGFVIQAEVYIRKMSWVLHEN